MDRTTLLSLLLLLGACSTPKDDGKPSGLAAIASGSLAVRAPAPSAASPAAPEKPIIRRPKDAADLLLSSEKRNRVESLAPRASGFVTSSELEEKLYAMQLARGKDQEAMAAFDRLAKGRWVLFTGNIGSPTPESFELPIRYTPKDPNDMMGLTAVWIPVKFTGVKGYDAKEYRAGELAAVLARYDGQGKASDGYDVVMLQKWFD